MKEIPSHKKKYALSKQNNTNQKTLPNQKHFSFLIRNACALTQILAPTGFCISYSLFKVTSPFFEIIFP